MTKVLVSFSDRVEPFGIYGPTPVVCLFEALDTGERWLRCDDGPVGAAVWQQSKALGIAGLVRSEPFGFSYVATEHADMHGEFTNTMFDVPSRWWVEESAQCLPAVPELVGGLVLARSSFVHIHAHSEFSALDAMATIEEMADKIAEDNQGALALTDHGTCAGHPVLQEICLARGIQPIFGIEANLVEDRRDRESRDYWHFLLLAMSDVGLRNLWAASTIAYTEGFYYRSRMDFEILERYSEGLMASTACLRGPLSRLIHQGDESGARAMLSRLQGIFPGRLCVELHTCNVEYDEKPEKGGLHLSQRFLNEALVSLARDAGLPLIVVCDAHYASCDDHALHKVWIAAQTNKDLTDDQDLFSGDERYYLKTAQEVANSIAYLGQDVVTEAMANTVHLAMACDATIKPRTSTPVYHRVGYDDGKAQDVLVLRRICQEGWDRKIDPLDPALLETTYNEDGSILREGYRPRFEREIEMLVSKGFAGYFLVVWDYCNWSRQQGALMGPGRGSVVGSLVAWLMGITGIDPIEADLMFERFITAGRTSPPDIDLDFPSSFRSKIIDYLVERWGVEHTVRVGTITRLKNKGVFVKLAAVLKQTYIDRGTPIDYADITKISEIITKAEAHTAGAGLKWDELWDQEADLLEPYREKYPEMVEMADKLVKRLSTYGKHPSGMIIDPENNVLAELPLRIPNDKDRTVVTQFDMVMAEFLGYLKFDILTIRNLDTIQMALDLIHTDPLNAGLKVNPEEWGLHDEYADPQVWDMLCDGDTLGVFQIETASGTQLVRQMQPRSIADLAAILTLVRPGPMRSGLTGQYIARRFGREEVTHIDSRMEFVLGKTYGCMIYQEDIMAVCSTLAGYDLEESDKIRAILGKKKVELAAKEGARFIERAIANGVSDDAATRIWRQMEQFARYTFNRAHAWSYAQLAYWCAWLKCHFPAYFYVALLCTVDDNKRLPDFVEGARRSGYTVHGPDINQSAEGFTVGEDRISVRYGFSSVPGVGDAAAAAIMENRPYTSWEDFVTRRGPKCNWGHIKTLAQLGAFDGLLPEGQHRASLEALVDVMSVGKDDACVFKSDEPMVWDIGGQGCDFDWAGPQEVQIGKSGKPLKRRPLPKACTRACRHFTPPTETVWPSAAQLTPRQIGEREHQVLGVYLAWSPFRSVDESDLKRVGAVYGVEVEALPEGISVIYGMIHNVKEHVTAGGTMAFLAINSMGYMVDVTVFAKTYAQYKPHLRRGTLCFMEVLTDPRGAKFREFVPVEIR